MQLEEFKKKFPNKSINEYFAYIRDINKSNSIDDLKITFENLDNSEYETQEGFNEENQNEYSQPLVHYTQLEKPKSALIPSIIVILSLFTLSILISNLILGANPVPNKTQISKELKILIDESKDCIKIRQSNPELFKICQNNIHFRSKQLNPIDQEIFTNEITMLFESESNKSNKNDLVKNPLTTLPSFLFVISISISYLLFLFYFRVESNWNGVVYLIKFKDKIIGEYDREKQYDSITGLYVFYDFANEIKLLSSRNFNEIALNFIKINFQKVLLSSLAVSINFYFFEDLNDLIIPIKFYSQGFHIILTILLILMPFTILIFSLNRIHKYIKKIMYFPTLYNLYGTEEADSIS